MLSRSPQSPETPHIGGKLAVVIFVLTLLAFVIESQLTQYVQTTLRYRQPFFLFYLVHSAFAIIFPIHLLYLITTTKYSATSILEGLGIAISSHLSSREASSSTLRFPYAKFLRLILAMTLGITVPALLWFAAVSLAPVSDVTAIWNTNAFFAYLISVKLFKLEWESRRLFAVLLATLGVIVVVYGGSTSSGDDTPSITGSGSVSMRSFKPSAPLVGNLLTLVASFGYGLYQVLYKIYAALPSDPEVTSDILYERILDEQTDVGHYNVPNEAAADHSLFPPPFGLHPNLLTSAIGLATLILLWIPIPILNATGAETFRLPPNGITVLAIGGIALSGVVFNAGFMILLGIWGPIITSVGNLLTIVLVLISDVIFGSGLDALTVWSLLGSGVIVLAFGVLAYDMFKTRA